MPLPAIGPLAVIVARAIAAQAVKQGVKELPKAQARVVARQVIAKQRSTRSLSGKDLDRVINRANQSARSTRPVKPKGGGLRTTPNRPRVTKVSNVAATRIAEQSAGPRARRLGGSKELRSVAPKPGVKLTTQTSGGGSTKMGPAKPIKAKLTQTAQGPRRPFEKLPTRTREVTGEVSPSFGKPKVKVDRNRPKENPNKPKTNVTVERTKPRKRSEVLAERDRLRRERLRKALTPRPKPLGPNKKVTPRVDKDKSPNVPDRPEPQGITVRGKFYPEGVQGLPARGGGVEPKTINSRIAEKYEKAPRSSEASTGDKEGSKLAQRSIKEAGKPSLKTGADFKPGKNTSKVKPGVRTNTTRLIREIKKSTNPAEKKAKTAELKRAIRNQRKVLRDREIKQAAERRRLAEEKGN
jgi:hypothetical protein